MANVADAESDVADNEEAGAGKKRFTRKTLIMAAGALAALLVVGGGSFFFLHKEKPAAAEQKAVFIPVPEMTVNIANPDSQVPRYLRLKIALEVHDERLVEQVQPMLPRVMDAFQIQLREMRPEDFEGSAALYRLKEELLRRINQAVFPAKVDAVLFNEILIQ
jgi:flagellar FliL protein